MMWVASNPMCTVLDNTVHISITPVKGKEWKSLGKVGIPITFVLETRNLLGPKKKKLLIFLTISSIQVSMQYTPCTLPIQAFKTT